MNEEILKLIDNKDYIGINDEFSLFKYNHSNVSNQYDFTDTSYINKKIIGIDLKIIKNLNKIAYYILKNIICLPIFIYKYIHLCSVSDVFYLEMIGKYYFFKNRIKFNILQSQTNFFEIKNPIKKYAKYLYFKINKKLYENIGLLYFYDKKHKAEYYLKNNENSIYLTLLYNEHKNIKKYFYMALKTDCTFFESYYFNRYIIDIYDCKQVLKNKNYLNMILNKK